MNSYLAAAAILSAVVATGHTVIGEWMVFRHMRRSLLVPVDTGPGLREFQIRILWATWHVVSLLGLALAALLWSFAQMPTPRNEWLQLIAAAFAASGALVAFATRLQHLAWIALLLIAGLIVFS